MFLSFRISSFILIILLLFRLSIFQWSTTTGGQDETDGNAGQDGGAGRHGRYVFCYSFSSYSSLFFFSLLLSLLSQTTATDEATPSGTGQDGTTRRQQCGTGGRWVGGGGRRREEGCCELNSKCGNANFKSVVNQPMFAKTKQNDKAQQTLRVTQLKSCPRQPK